MNNTNEMPLVSIIIPCYNCEAYVEDAVNSMMNQTYPNTEIIIVNDFSSDLTGTILEHICRKNRGIRLYNHSENQGLIYTLNELIGLAKGKYIARMDGDDVSEPSRIEKQVKYLEKNKNCVACGTLANFIDQDGILVGKSNLPVSEGENRYFLKFYSTLIHPSVMIRKNVAVENLYDYHFLHCEDYELWVRLVYQKNYNIANIDEYLFNYRITDTGITSKHNREQHILSAEIIKKYKVVPTNFIEVHNEIFFINTGSYDVKHYKYIKTIIGELNKREFSPSSRVIKNLLHFLKKKSRLFEIISIMFDVNVFKTIVIKLVYDKKQI